MSRIDQALRRAEEAALLEDDGGEEMTIVAEREDARALLLELDEYPGEQDGRQEGPPPKVSRPVIPLRTLTAVEPPLEEVGSRRADAWRSPIESAVHPMAEPEVVPERWNPPSPSRLVAGPGIEAPMISVEQYRRLAAALHDVHEERGIRTVMVTSTVPGEGKTLTVANLGLTLSESYGRRVLIIDADLRRPSVHEVFGIQSSTGLSDLLTAEEGHDEPPIVSVTASLSVLPAGNPDSSPLAGLTSERMAALLEDCARQYDWVLIDTPPVGLLPDAHLLARLAHAVIFVIGARSTPSALVERAVSDLGPDRIIGTVLNRVDERTVPEISYYAAYGN